jgi:hypothetical protein
MEAQPYVGRDCWAALAYRIHQYRTCSRGSAALPLCSRQRNDSDDRIGDILAGALAYHPVITDCDTFHTAAADLPTA